MGGLSRRIVARWGLAVAQGSRVAYISPEVIAWVERTTRQAKFTPTDYVNELTRLDLQRPLTTFTPVPSLEDEAFGDARLAIEGALPKFMATLQSKFRDTFHMRATHQKFRLHYYFAGDPALENIAMTLTFVRGKLTVYVGYVPIALNGTADFKRAISAQTEVGNPDTAGLAALSVLRKVLSKVQ